MVNINGKEWSVLEAADIQAVISEQDFDESFYFEFKNDKVAPKNVMEVSPAQVPSFRQVRNQHFPASSESLFGAS